MSASFVSLLIGLVMVSLLRRCENLDLPIADVNAATNLKASALNMKGFGAHLVPRSAFEAMATNEILQIVVFSLGVVAAALGDKAKRAVQGVEELAHMILKITGVVDRTFQHLAETRELVHLYNRWFRMPLPTGEQLGIPMSPQLEEAFTCLVCRTDRAEPTIGPELWPAEGGPVQA